MADSPLDQRLDRWQQNLLDLTMRNRLLNFKPEQAVQVMAPAGARMLEMLVSDASSTTLIELQPFQDANALASSLPRGQAFIQPGGADKLKKIWLKARQSMREQGVNIMFLAAGTMRWSDPNESQYEAYAPLVMVPIEITRQSPQHPFRIKAMDDDVTTNPTLAFKVSSSFGIDLPEWKEGMTLEDYMALTREAVAELKGWRVDDRSFLCLLSFSKVSMYRDLLASRDLAHNSPALMALAGEAVVRKPHVAPAGMTYQILDADSSQQEAVEMSRTGESFVLQGPPGTGKSQTISNMISQALADGRKVLFVSEKLAALEVVKKRLDEKGLGPYLLELHSHRTDRSRVMEDLRECLSPRPPKPLSPKSTARLDDAAATLDRYVAALHEVREPMSRSAHQVHARLASLLDAPLLPTPVQDPLRLTVDEVEDRARLCGEVQGIAQLASCMDSHAWSDLRVENWKSGDQAAVVRELKALGDEAQQTGIKLARLADAADVQAPTDMAGCEFLLEWMEMTARSPLPPRAWLAPGVPEKLMEDLRRAREFYQGRDDKERWLENRYSPDVLSIDTDSMLQRARGAGFLKFLDNGYKNDKATLRSFLRGGGNLSHDEMLHDLASIGAIRKARAAEEAAAQDARASFGSRFDGASTDWDSIRNLLTWCAEYNQSFGPLPPKIVDMAVDRRASAKLEVPLRDSREQMERMREAVDAVNARFLPKDEAFPLEAQTLPALELFAARRLGEIGSLAEYANACDVERNCQEAGVGEVFALARRGRLPDGDLADAYRHRAYSDWLAAIRASDIRLGGFNSRRHNDALDTFRRLDAQQMDEDKARLLEMMNTARYVALEKHGAAGGVELPALRRELEKKKRFRPLREMFNDMPELLTDLKPCMFMSPLSVAKYLDPSKIHFDLLIFDEASQVRPEDAAGAMIRSDQVIVVGDGQQLPPTSFFQTTADDGDDEVRAADLESILDECSASAMPRHMLQWHYRSRDESLIAFSNQHIYGGRLMTFPSADQKDGIDFVRVRGVYDRSKTRTNPVEAEKVASLVIEHFRSRPESSLGVVAFSEAQQMEIVDKVEKLRLKNPDLEKHFEEGGPDEFFVKNLETVQGDERDVIILDVGYGKDADGRMAQNFGPLNQAGGERRLNVAITRARQSMVVVSSIGPEDVTPSSPGPRMLKEYLEFAAGAGLKASQGEDQGHLFEEQVYRALAAEGISARRRVGRSACRVDIAIEDWRCPGKYVLGIMCDGEPYAAAATTRDRERLREEALGRLGWNLIRIWSQDWVDDRETQLARVRRALEESGYYADQQAGRAVDESNA